VKAAPSTARPKQAVPISFIKAKYSGPTAGRIASGTAAA